MNLCTCSTEIILPLYDTIDYECLHQKPAVSYLCSIYSLTSIQQDIFCGAKVKTSELSITDVSGV